MILLDVMMQTERVEGGGSRPTWRKGIAVIMVTALDQPSDVDRAVEVGTNDFHQANQQTKLLLRIRAIPPPPRRNELARPSITSTPYKRRTLKHT